LEANGAHGSGKPKRPPASRYCPTRRCNHGLGSLTARTPKSVASPTATPVAVWAARGASVSRRNDATSADGYTGVPSRVGHGLAERFSVSIFGSTRTLRLTAGESESGTAEVSASPGTFMSTPQYQGPYVRLCQIWAFIVRSADDAVQPSSSDRCQNSRCDRSRGGPLFGASGIPPTH
jgi:hypothetical protein